MTKRSVLQWTGIGVAGALAIGIALRVGGTGVSSAAPVESSSPTSARASESSPAAMEAFRQRLLADDRLTPPPLDASPGEKKLYEETLKAIQSGKDPLAIAKAADVRSPEMQQRLAERKKAAEERRASQKQMSKERQQAHEARHADALRRKNEHFEPHPPAAPEDAPLYVKPKLAPPEPLPPVTKDP